MNNFDYDKEFGAEGFWNRGIPRVECLPGADKDKFNSGVAFAKIIAKQFHERLVEIRRRVPEIVEEPAPAFWGPPLEIFNGNPGLALWRVAVPGRGLAVNYIAEVSEAPRSTMFALMGSKAESLSEVEKDEFTKIMKEETVEFLPAAILEPMPLVDFVYVFYLLYLILKLV